MLGGILIIFSYAKTLNLLSLYETSPVWIPQLAKSPGIMVLVTLLLLAGPIGKSAQFPLLEWLPEAMAGPAPVSALIHAATMVKSGVYLVARFFPIFYYGYWVAGCGEAYAFFVLIAWVGVFTSFLAATQGMVSSELKKVLAYSTVSQIGYMMLALGVAGFSPSIAVGGLTSGTLHLISHALFKACLFLCAGSVIHAAHSIYVNDMGSMRRYMPFTWIFMSIAALSLMGVPPLSGFWSKDAILISCMEARDYPLFFFALVTVILTAFYTTRFIGMVFYGKKSEHLEHIERKGLSLSEAHRTMVISCGVLAMMILLLSLFSPSLKKLLGEGLEEMLAKMLPLPAGSVEHSSLAHLLVPLLSTLCVGFGMLPAYFLYISGKRDPAALLERRPILKRLYRFFGERWYLNRLYYHVVVGGMARLFNSVPRWIEDPLDKLFHHLIPSVPEGLYRMGRLMIGFPDTRRPVEGAWVEVPTVGITLGFTLGLALLFIALYLIAILILGWFLGS
jgi:NADH-quinone oxidoreductase subunit L